MSRESAVRVTMSLSDGTERRNMYHLAEGTRVESFTVDGQVYAPDFLVEELFPDEDGRIVALTIGGTRFERVVA